MKRLIGHVNVILSGMVLTLLLIDRVNSAMQFIDNPLTKGLLFGLCGAALLSGILLQASRRPKRGRNG